jgi:AraC-like DNA-binding protein
MGSDKKKDFVSDIYDYLVSNYQQSITLENISQIFSFHPAHIIRCVKGRYGMSPLQLLLEIRINAAKQLLTDTDKTIHQIGEDVGFGDASYFTKQFKKRIGVTPLEYRKSTQKKELQRD